MACLAGGLGPSSMMTTVGSFASSRTIERRAGGSLGWRRAASDVAPLLPSHGLPSRTVGNGDRGGRHARSPRQRRTGIAAVAVPSDDSEGLDGGRAETFGGGLPASEIASLQRRALGFMFASYTSIYFVRKPFSVVKAPMQDALQLSNGALAGIDSAFLGLYAIGQLVLPALGDRLGARKMLVVGYLFSAIACFGFGLTAYPIFLAGVRERSFARVTSPSLSVDGVERIWTFPNPLANASEVWVSL